MNTKRIVTVQDISCLGQCSVTVALPILSSYGIETAILPSSILSTHTGGFVDYTVLDLTNEMPGIVRSWEKNHITFDAIYTGYIGCAAQFQTIDYLGNLLNEGGKLIVDPAMADHGKLYKALDKSIVLGMRQLVSKADVILPNQTEAAFLLGEDYKEDTSKNKAFETAKRLSGLGPSTVILTGVSDCDNKIGAIAYDKNVDTFFEFFTDKIGTSYHGTGDIFSSVVVGKLLNDSSLKEALKEACLFVAKSIEKTLEDQTHKYGVKFEQVLAEGIILNK